MSFSSTVPHESMGSAGPASDLFFQSAGDELEVTSRSGVEVRFRARREGANAEALASNIRYRGLAGAHVDGDEIVATFVDKETASALTGSVLGLATGPFYEVPVSFGGRNLFGSRRSGPPAELVAARLGAHWQLLVGGDVDVAPSIDAKQAEYLRNFHHIRVRRLPSDATFTLVANPMRTASEDRAVLGLTSQAARGPSFQGRASAVLIRADDEAALAQFRKLSNRVWRQTGLRPSLEQAPLESFQTRVLLADFDFVLAPLPAEPSTFLPWLLTGGPLERLELGTPEVEEAIRQKNWQSALSLLGGFIRRLDEFHGYVAYNAKWCGEPEPQAHSWAWIGELRPCEDVQ